MENSWEAKNVPLPVDPDHDFVGFYFAGYADAESQILFDHMTGLKLIIEYKIKFFL
jgi:hypothetical protein